MEDLLQEAFIELFRSLPSYRGDAKLTTWTDRITTRVAYRFLRRQRAQPSAATSDESAVAAAPELELEAREDLRRVYAALSTLKAEYRIAFALFATAGKRCWVDAQACPEMSHRETLGPPDHLAPP